jgi:MoaA/NifB/PqqE/SkfB family radical SAM enzyme
MKSQGFRPKEVLFSPTTNCNLRCAHCDIERRPGVLGKKAAVKFLISCGRAGINRVGFTGGEPFLALDFMCAVSKEALRRGMLFGRIMTNGSWFEREKELVTALDRLYNSGYDGDICLSVDAFHCQNIQKCASFIRAAAEIWARPDIVSIAAVKGAKEKETGRKIVRLARILHACPVRINGKLSAIKGKNIFIRISHIDLSPIGKVAKLKNAWDGRWFKDDLCKGPGNVLFVLPDGTVKPCCGYAVDADILTIGSIKRDSPERILHNARVNRFTASIFSLGFHPIRKRLERSGVRFPGKTTNHCFFCHYLTHSTPRPLLDRSLRP